MWIFLNNAFLSVVAEKGRPDVLKVRGRFPGDIEKAFPEAKVTEGAGTDYRFRALVDREHVAQVMADAVRAIKATNFKDSVDQGWRHDLYLGVWGVMARGQTSRQRQETSSGS
ncbi:hypothetical protein A6A04_14835 [Paramagnetospirillum marisnigri]|uniref:Uncharacterized protein n=1 Tax=Paramagnetospirillum marisnigri TaxID=1285242 RepID=A0A178MT62_9PROT|nr:hypothetical protein [Paramagnetospirillum marisnigri]OAN52989.1 hypothetical protein A6A04_14835 [Paramagnetospirillum marisnigri]